MTRTKLSWWVLIFVVVLPAMRAGGDDLAPNRWVELSKDPAGARRGSSIRYVPDAGAFFLWGFMNADPELPQENPLMEVPEYDMVAFDPTAGLILTNPSPRGKLYCLAPEGGLQ